MVTFYLVRHGETEANKSGVMQGHLNTPLSLVGREQAKAVAASLRDVKFDAVYTSDLARAADTARAIMEHRSCPLIMDRRLREINMGLLQGLNQSEIAERFPDFERSRINDTYNTRRPGGESPADLDQRLSHTMDDIYSWYAGRPGNTTIGIVSHGGSIRSILKKANPDPESISGVVGNCSVSVMECDDRMWRIVSMDDCGHLPDPDNMVR